MEKQKKLEAEKLKEKITPSIVLKLSIQKPIL
jgi:hypothetical protein